MALTPAETAELLAFAAAFDARTIGRADVLAWTDALADMDIDPADARQAVKEHYQTETRRVMPADVRRRVREIRARRAKHHVVPAPPAELADRPDRYQATLRESVAAAARRPHDGALAIGAGADEVTRRRAAQLRTHGGGRLVAPGTVARSSRSEQVRAALDAARAACAEAARLLDADEGGEGEEARQEAIRVAAMVAPAGPVRDPRRRGLSTLGADIPAVARRVADARRDHV